MSEDVLNDFYSSLGYELPNDMVEAVAGEQMSFYKHKPGYYKGFIGKLIPRYKDIEGKKCDATTPGAKISHYLICLWITNYLGTTEYPETVQFINNDLSLPEDKDLKSFYFNSMVSIVPRDQWKNFKLFESFMLPNHESTKIVQVNPTDPSSKITVFKNFPVYYGLPVSFTVEESSKNKDSVFVTSITITDYSKRVPVDSLRKLEQDFDARLQKEIQERNDKNNNPQQSYTIPEPEEVDFSSLIPGISETPSQENNVPNTNTKTLPAENNPLAGFFNVQ